MQGMRRTRMWPVEVLSKCSRFFRAVNLDYGALFSMQKCLHSTEGNENDEVLVEHLGGIRTIGINRPHKRNCINKKTAEKLLEAFSQFESDDEAYMGVLYGTGGNFCSGYDLEELSECDRQQGKGLEPMVNVPFPKVSNWNAVLLAADFFRTFMATPIFSWLSNKVPSKSHLRKPLVAAVNGYALGAGFELALMCDLRVVEETAIFGFFNRRFGVPSINGGTVRLQALVGLSRALDLILTGRAVKSEEAFACGLANRVVACGTALGQAINLASSIRKFPQACLAADRTSAYYASFTACSMEDAMKFEQDNAQHIIEKESLSGAGKFLSGTGKHGDFKNISDDNFFARPHNKVK